MAASHSNFAVKVFQDYFLALNFAFFDENYPTRKKFCDIFDSQKCRAVNSPLHFCYDSTTYCHFFTSNRRFRRGWRLRVRRFAACDWALSQRLLHVSVLHNVRATVRCHYLYMCSHRHCSWQTRLRWARTIFSRLPHGEQQTQGKHKRLSRI